jgi:fermentation-respiration switch protein FrsA (DUF1100 family)
VEIPEGSEGNAEEEPELDAWAWFRRDEATQAYRFLDEGMRTLAAAIRSAGGVDGVIGFSQGAAMAALLAASLEIPGRVPSTEVPWLKEVRDANGGEPLRFAALYSGFYARDESLASWVYDPKIQTPTLHYFGSLDTVVDEERSQGLVDRCEDPVVVVHPGGHYVPVAKEWAMPLAGFIKKIAEQSTEEISTS